MRTVILIVLSLKEGLKRFFGDHYPNEIIQLIIMKYHLPAKISCGFAHTVLLNEKVYVWGCNRKGQLGLGNYEDKNSPQELLPKNLDFSITDIECGADYTVSLTTQGDMFGWGNNYGGQIGYNSADFINEPLIISSLIKKISCGNCYTISITECNSMNIWGVFNYGRFGTGMINDIRRKRPIRFKASSYDPIQCYLIFTEYYFGFSKNKLTFRMADVLALQCGVDHVVMLSARNKLFGWGSNKYGQLGLGDMIDRDSPQELLLEKVISVRCGKFYTLALTLDGDVYSWGDNRHGSLGLGNQENQLLPQKISLPKIISISCGLYHTVAVTPYNEIYVWGKNEYGQLGLGDNIDRNIPCLLNFGF